MWQFIFCYKDKKNYQCFKWYLEFNEIINKYILASVTKDSGNVAAYQFHWTWKRRFPKWKQESEKSVYILNLVEDRACLLNKHSV